jgi:hypothetical protein
MRLTADSATHWACRLPGMLLRASISIPTLQQLALNAILSSNADEVVNVLFMVLAG